MTKFFSLSVLLTAAFAVVPAAAQTSRQASGEPGGFALPDGSAKQLVQERCIGCHDLRRVVNSNYSPDEWQNVVNMMKSAGAPINQAEADQIRDYLNANFPGKPRPQPVVLPGPVNIKFKQWPTPTPGSRPHDPLAMPDGTLWWSGQFANVLGRLDPATGEMKEFPLPPHSGPHGLINDKEGFIWYAGNWGGHIGRLDPKTGEVKTYPLPDPKARDPHTPLFDKDGILWFSVQNGGYMGRLRSQDRRVQARAAGWRIRPAAVRAALPLGRPPALVQLFRLEQDRDRRSRHDGSEGVRAAGAQDPHPPHGRHLRRHDLVRRLVERQACRASIRRPARSSNGRARAGNSRSPTA